MQKLRLGYINKAKRININSILTIILLATSNQPVIAVDLQRNYEYQNGEIITLQSPISQELSNKFGQGWWKADLTKKLEKKYRFTH